MHLALALLTADLPASAADTGGYGWKLTFEDGFDDPAVAIAKGADPTCYSLPATCVDLWNRYDCAPEFQAQLAGLNKCHWQVFDQYNWMDQNAPQGRGFNALHPSQVRVEAGHLHLTANRAPGDSSSRDCKNSFFDPALGAMNLTKNCEILSGAVKTERFERNGKIFGFQQKFGRFEVRAKVSHGPGSWPAAWILAAELENSCGWPHTGELDLIEAWENLEDKAFGTYHDGICSKSVHLSKSFEKKFPGGSLYNAFHTFAVEWNEQSVEFLIDEESIGTVSRGEKVEGKLPDGSKQWFGAEIPTGPFYWILNNSIVPLENPARFTPQDFVIDHVRTWEACTASDAPETCTHFFRESSYNSYAGETARMNLMAYPSPVIRGQNLTLQLTSFQDCEQVRLELVSATGQRLAPLPGPEIFQMASGEGRRLTIPTEGLPAGVSLIRAEFAGCGADRRGRGNEVFKLILH
jgi:hypothetical protein